MVDGPRIITTVPKPKPSLPLRIPVEPPSYPKDRELDQETLRRVLQLMADFLDSRGIELILPVLGGVICVLFLGTRLTTHDVDFFGVHICDDDLKRLDAAIRHAEKRYRKWLGDNWFNNQPAFIMDRDVQISLTEQALKQNEIVFYRKGLKLVAAPWHYSVCAKMARITNGISKPYDAMDAAHYLERHFKIHGYGPVTVEQIQDWAASYRRNVSVKAICNVSLAYRKFYKGTGFEGFLRFCACHSGKQNDMKCLECGKKVL